MFFFLLGIFLIVVVHADNFNFPSAECFNNLLCALNSGSTSDDKSKHTDTNYTDHDRYIMYELIFFFRWKVLNLRIVLFIIRQ